MDANLLLKGRMAINALLNGSRLEKVKAMFAGYDLDIDDTSIFFSKKLVEEVESKASGSVEKEQKKATELEEAKKTAAAAKSEAPSSDGKEDASALIAVE